MPLEIDGIEYLTAVEVCRAVGVVRQTLWRWRRSRRIPQGRRYRDRAIVFTREELDSILEYSNRLEPADAGPGIGRDTSRRAQKGIRS